MSRIWKRLVWITAFALIAAVLVNVAVAWGMAGWMTIDRNEVWLVPGEREKSRWTAHHPEQSNVEPVFYSLNQMRGFELLFYTGSQRGESEFRAISTGPDRHLTGMKIHSEDGGRLDSLLLVRAGWPKPALSGAWWEFGNTFSDLPMYGTAMIANPPDDNAVVQHAFVLAHTSSSQNVEHRLLPWRPIWKGLAVNVLLYACVTWLLLAGPLIMRHLWRKWRGCCTNCGYNLRGSTGRHCPECGATSPIRPAAPPHSLTPHPPSQ